MSLGKKHVPTSCGEGAGGRVQKLDEGSAHARPAIGDVSGAFADLGTFIPLVTGMVLLGGLDPSRVLVGFGIFAIATGVFYRRPVPVQPMKVVAALAIAGAIDANAVIASGIVIGVVLVVLAMTGLIERLQTLVPKAVLHGVQLGLGATLIWAAAMLPKTSLPISAVLLLLLLGAQRTRLGSYSALGLIGCGLAYTFFLGAHDLPNVAFALPSFAVIWPAWPDFVHSGYSVLLPQLAMTLTNAVLLTAILASEYFPQSKDHITTRNLALSSGFLNVVLAPFGAVPMCHGAGGLAAQYGQGARTGLAPIIFGAFCLALAVMAGTSAMQWLMQIPAEVIAALLAFAGVQLMSLNKLAVASQASLVVVVATALVSLATNVAIGLVAGLVLARVSTAIRDFTRT